MGAYEEGLEGVGGGGIIGDHSDAELSVLSGANAGILYEEVGNGGEVVLDLGMRGRRGRVPHGQSR